MEQTGYDAILGNYVRIAHGDIQSIYGHLRLICVEQGMAIEAGAVLGVTGSSGRSTGEHLHFSVKLGCSYIDPISFLLALKLKGIRRTKNH